MTLNAGNYFNNQINQHQSQIDLQDQRDNALDQYISDGKKRILNNREFAGLSFSDFVDYYVGEHLVHGKSLVDGLIKFVACHEPDSTNHNAQNLMAHQAFMLEALDSFIEYRIEEIKTAFDAETRSAA